MAFTFFSRGASLGITRLHSLVMQSVRRESFLYLPLPRLNLHNIASLTFQLKQYLLAPFLKKKILILLRYYTIVGIYLNIF